MNKNGRMVQKTAVAAKSAALARAGSGVRPPSANLCSSPQLFWGEVFRAHAGVSVLALHPPATLLPDTRRAILIDTRVE
jgi:hypothetical protein